MPKDGPSAGAITTAMVSALTGAPVKRGIAMTGEVTLRGRVLPIGGLREKTMAALRNGIQTVIIPADNAKDLDEIDQSTRPCAMPSTLCWWTRRTRCSPRPSAHPAGRRR